MVEYLLYACFDAGVSSQASPSDRFLMRKTTLRYFLADQHKEVAVKTAESIDEEIRSVIDCNYQRTRVLSNIVAIGVVYRS